jgi:hypothetical protein
MDILTAVPTSKAFFVIRTFWLKLSSDSDSHFGHSSGISSMIINYRIYVITRAKQ